MTSSMGRRGDGSLSAAAAENHRAVKRAKCTIRGMSASLAGWVVKQGGDLEAWYIEGARIISALFRAKIARGLDHFDRYPRWCPHTDIPASDNRGTPRRTKKCHLKQSTINEVRARVEQESSPADIVSLGQLPCLI